MVNLEGPHFSTAAPLSATRRTFQPPFTFFSVAFATGFFGLLTRQECIREVSAATGRSKRNDIGGLPRTSAKSFRNCSRSCSRLRLIECLYRLGTLCLCGGERVKGIEPSYAAWEAAVLPLNYTRFFFGSGGHCQEIASSGVSLDDVPL